MGYCTRAEVFRWFPRGGIANPARIVSSVNTTTDTLTIDCHGLQPNEVVTFRASAGGELPEPLQPATPYYAIPVSESAFALASSPDSPPIDLITTGRNVLLISELPWDAWIEEATNELECTMPAHVVPLDYPYPAVVTRYVAGIVAEMAMTYSGVASDAIATQLDRVRAELAIWRKGACVRGPVEPKQAQVPLLWKAPARSRRRTLP